MREKPAVAVLDVHIPGGGAIAARGIKRCSPKTRVLALSAGDDRETVLEMLEAGADGYLMKGSSSETILTSIERAAHGQGSLSAEVTGGVIEELAGLLHARRRSDDRSRRREERVRHAIDDDVVHAVYQPICTLAGSTVGAEALARFRGPPARGPVRWFAEADEVGLLRELELAAVRAALVGLPDLPEHVFLAVNVSPSTLCTAAFLRLIAASDGPRLVVEITEHARIDDYDALREALDALRDFGVAHRDRRRRRRLREPAPHPPARARVHQARPHADRRHRGRPLAPGARGGPDLVRREDRRDDRRGGHRAPCRGREALGARRALRAGLLLRPARAHCRCRCSWARLRPTRTRRHERQRQRQRQGRSRALRSGSSWRTIIPRSWTP